MNLSPGVFTAPPRVLFLLLTLTLGFSGTARAATWFPGDVITYSEDGWGGNPLTSPGAALVVNNFATVYTSGIFAVGITSGPGFAMFFTIPDDLVAYLPASGVVGPLTSSLLNPTSSPSGRFGGDVAALKLNIDFSDAGLLLGNSKIPVGNLVLSNFSAPAAVNGLTVRQLLDLDNTALGGGTTSFAITDLDTITANINLAFVGGTPSAFAQTNLVAPTAPTPEPSGALLVGLGVLGLGWSKRLRRRRK